MILNRNWPLCLLLLLVQVKTNEASENETSTIPSSDVLTSTTFAESQCVVITVSPDFSAIVLTPAQSQETVPKQIKEDLIDTNTSWQCRKHIDDPVVTDLCCASESAIPEFTPIITALANRGTFRIPHMDDFLKDWDQKARRNRNVIKYLIVGATMAAISVCFFLIWLCVCNPCKCCRLKHRTPISNRSTSTISVISSKDFGPTRDVIKSVESNDSKSHEA